jgi:hypothetical protein
MGLDEQLHRLQREASLDSKGQFSIETQRALRLMCESSLPNRELYLLSLIQSAIASGANRVDVKIIPSSLRIRFTSRIQSSPEDLRQVLAMASGFKGPSHLMHFARGLALGLGGGYSFEYCCPSGHLRVDGLSFKVFPGRPGSSYIKASWKEVSIFTRGLDLVRDQLGIGTRSLELSLLEKLCGHSAEQLVVNGFALRADFGGPPKFVGGKPNPDFIFLQAAILGKQQPGCLYCPIKDVLRSDETKRYRVEDDWKEVKVGFEGDSASCIARVGLRLGLEPLGRVTLVKDGVIVEQFEHDFGVKGVEALVACNGLRMDLSGLRAVRDSSFARMLDAVKQVAEQMVSELRSQQVLMGLDFGGRQVTDTCFLTAASGRLKENLDLTVMSSRQRIG